MVADAAAVRALLAPILRNMDDPVLDYVAVLIAEGEGGPTRPLAAEVVPFLVSTCDGSTTDDEDGSAALALCRRLEQLLYQAFGEEDVAREEAEVARLGKPMRMGEATQQGGLEVFGNERSSRGTLGSRAVDYEEDHSTAKKKIQHDGVPLSARTGPWSKPEVGLRAHGGVQRPRQQHAVGLEAPITSEFQLKVHSTVLLATFRG